jgi:hypothetical protein
MNNFTNYEDLRTVRNAVLAKCDYTQLSDSPLTDELKTEWKVYRQDLRNLPENTPDITNVTWPIEPGV